MRGRGNVRHPEQGSLLLLLPFPTAASIYRRLLGFYGWRRDLSRIASILDAPSSRGRSFASPPFPSSSSVPCGLPEPHAAAFQRADARNGGRSVGPGPSLGKESPIRPSFVPIHVRGEASTFVVGKGVNSPSHK